MSDQDMASPQAAGASQPPDSVPPDVSAADSAVPPAPTPDAQAAAPKPDAQAAAPTPDASPDPCADVTARIALVVDDEPANRDFLVRLLEQAQLEVLGASTGEEALQIAARTPCIHLLAIDNRLPDMDGVELVGRLRQQYPTAKIVMATMLDERALITKAFQNGCDIFMVKPHGFMELFRRLHNGEAYTQTTKLVIDQYGPRPYRG